MKAPASQFYWKDWVDDLALSSCSWAAQGVWPRVLAKLHQSDEYGVLRWPLKTIAQTAGVPLRYVRELADKNVLKGSDQFDTDFVHVPRHAGQSLPPVVLVKATGGSCWFSKRFVLDHWRSARRGEGSRFTSEHQPDRAPTRRMGERLGDGPASAFASASADGIDTLQREQAPTGGAEDLARALRENGYSECSAFVTELIEAQEAGVTYDQMVAIARSKGGPDKSVVYLARTAIGKLRDKAKQSGQEGGAVVKIDVAEQARRARADELDDLIRKAHTDRRLGIIDDDDTLAARIAPLRAELAGLQREARS